MNLCLTRSKRDPYGHESKCLQLSGAAAFLPGAPVLAVERPGYDAHKVRRCVPSSVAEAAPEAMLERPDEAEAATQGGGWLLE